MNSNLEDERNRMKNPSLMNINTSNAQFEN